MQGKYSIKGIIYSMIKIIGIVMVTVFISLTIDMKMLESRPANMLNRISKSNNITSDVGKYQLIIRYQEGDARVGYMITDLWNLIQKKQLC